MADLDKRRALSKYDHNDYFWSGIQPTSLRNLLELELRSRELWTDQTLPPSMERVIEVATKHLEHDLYQPRGRGSKTKSASSCGRHRHQEESEDESEEDTDSELESLLEEGESELSDDEETTNGKARKKKGKGVKLNRKAKELKEEEQVPEKPDLAIQSNIEDLADRFKCLELKLIEQSQRQENQPSKARPMYCFMCGQTGHGIQDCINLKILIGQGVCRMDLNGQVVMSDGSLLLCGEGEGGAARIIRLKLSLGVPLVVPTSTSASNVEVNPAEPYYKDEPEELAILGAMEVEVIPVERTDKSK